MADLDKDLIQRFKEVLDSLPEDKRLEMYNRLKSMSDEQRTAAMKAIVAKAGAVQSKQSESAAPQAPEKPVRVERGSEEAKSKPVKTLKKKYRNMLIGALAVVCALIIGVEVYRNMDKIKGTVPEDTTVAASATEEAETTPEETTEAEPTPTPTVTPTPAPTSVPLDPNAPDLTGLVIVIDPGHQEVTSEETELCASWLSVEKPRCTTGGTGVSTGVNEYDLTLQYALIMRDYMEQCGATVILTRETSDVDLSNQERAQIAVDNNASVFIRLHADSANDSMQSGVRVYVPDSGSYSSQNLLWGNNLGQAVAAAEGLEFTEARQTYLYTGLNYANSVPSFQISVGFLSNSDDEVIITSEDNMVSVAGATAMFCADFTI